MTLLLAFALSAGYRRDRPGNRAAMRRWEWVVLVGFYGVMIWLAFSELADLG